MMDSINAYVLEQAATCSLRWRDLSNEAFPININESPASFYRNPCGAMASAPDTG